MRCSYQTPGASWACGNMKAHHSPPTALCSWTAPNRYPLLQPLLDGHIFPLRLKTFCVMRLADGNLFMRTADALGQRALFSIFYNDLVLVWIQSGLFQSFALCSGMWSYFRSFFFFFPPHFIAHHLVLQRVFLLGWAKKQDLPSHFNSCLLCMEARLRHTDWTVFGVFFFFLKNSPCTLLISGVGCFAAFGEKRLAQSSLAKPCITRMPMSYEAIHLLEMPPWFQFESCLQSHCVSPLLHVKEVSLCERSEGDNCT